MYKLMTALSFAALALVGINAGVAQTNVAQTNVAQTNLQAAEIKYDFPADEIDSDDQTLKQFADTRDNQRPAPTGNDDDPNMRLFSG